MSNQPLLYAGVSLPLRESLVQTHSDIWRRLSSSGPFWTGQERMKIIQEARQAQVCSLCQRRKQALSPESVQGKHDTQTDLSDVAVDVIHRTRTDPARMTKSVFERATENGLSVFQYIELIGVMACSTVIDTLHQAVGLNVPATLDGSTEPAKGQDNPDVTEAGAWVPIAKSDGTVNEIGIPNTANIVRSMGLVPEIVTLFFHVMRQGYFINKLPISLSRSQTELVAARVSALNQCFY